MNSQCRWLTRSSVLDRGARNAGESREASGGELPPGDNVVGVGSAWSAGNHGPLRVEHHVAARFQRARVDSCCVPFGARPRRFRRTLLLSSPRPSGDRCRRQCFADGDRATDRAISALFERARGVLGRSLRNERDPEGRQRRPREFVGWIEGACGHFRCHFVRRTRPQVSDLGTRALSRTPCEGHRDGADADQAFGIPRCGIGSARSTGMTSGRDTGQPEVAGGLARHIPVLVRTVVDFLNVRAGGTYIDATFGAGGYTRALLGAANCRVIAIDRDHTAIAAGSALVEEFGGRLALIEGRFSDLDQAVDSAGSIDGVVLDLGVSSMQLDTAERGFSFRLDGPLDMRMGGEGASAAELVAKASEHHLAAIISTLGEERHARAVARAIVRARTETPILSTSALAGIVGRVVHSRPGDIHPATRTFQALRMFVNDELGELARALIAAERVLKA